jgi:uncharacterized iron-regulated membrane protein
MGAEPAALRRHGRWAALLLLAAATALAVVGVWRATLAPATSPEEAAQRSRQVQALVARCTADMVAQTCRVMQGPAMQLIPADAHTVFVAGLGPMPAELYRQLRDQGQGMCEPLKAACQQDWSGSTCRTARTLYGGA